MPRKVPRSSQGGKTLLPHPGTLAHNSKMSVARNWCFTLNNYTDNDILKIQQAAQSGRIEYVVYGKETSSTGTPHLQGTVVLKKKGRLTGLVKLLGQAHYTVCRDLFKSIEYCKKEGDITEFGTCPERKSGQRDELELFKDAVKSGIVDHKTLRETHSNVWSRYHRFCLSYIRDNKPLPEIPSHSLYDWQTKLVEHLSTEPDSRTVHFLVDPVGNAGKSYICAYIEKNFPNTQVMKCGKRDDMAFELDDTVKILIIDVSRSSSEFLNYQFLEDVKDGRVFSPKYESYTKRFNSPHLVVMMNQDPDATKLSEDRYNIVYIN